MSERLTDKKRGFIGELGNLISNVNGLSLNRFMREELGGLSQSQLKRFTPEGNVTVQSFGMYEKVIPEMVEVKAKEVANDCLVVLTYFADSIWAWLLYIAESGYRILRAVNISSLLGYSIRTVSWDYQKNKFLVFLSSGKLYEVTSASYSGDPVPLHWGMCMADGWAGGEAVLKAQYQGFIFETGYGGFWINPDSFYISYGENGTESFPWLTLSLTSSSDGGYEWLLPLNRNYGFGSYDNVDPNVIMGISESQCEKFSGTIAAEDNFIYLTHTGVRIVRPDVYPPEFEGGSRYAQVIYREACEVKNRMAVIYDPDFVNQEDPVVIKLCGPYKDASGDQAYFNDSTIIKTSNILSPATEAGFWDSKEHFNPVFWYPTIEVTILSTEYPAVRGGYTGLVATYEYTYWDPDRSMQVTGQDEAFWYGTFSGTRQVLAQIISPPVNVQNHHEFDVYVLDPDGESHKVAFPNWYFPAPEPDIYWHLVIMAYQYISIAQWQVGERYSGIAFVNDKYAVVGQSAKYVPRLFVMDQNGAEKGDIEFLNVSAIKICRAFKI